MSHLERALQVDVPYPCLTCGINLEEGVLYCPDCWAQKQADREVRCVLPFAPARVRRSLTVRVQITRHGGVESLSGAPSSDRLGHVLPSACLSGPVSALWDPDAGRPDGGVE